MLTADSPLATVTLATPVKRSMHAKTIYVEPQRRPHSEKGGGFVCYPDLAVPGREAKRRGRAEVKETQRERGWRDSDEGRKKGLLNYCAAVWGSKVGGSAIKKPRCQWRKGVCGGRFQIIQVQL
ncbi:unnamed protein product [Boreogadus saida]